MNSFVLLVEDREDDIELILRAFKKAGVPSDFVVARDPMEALAILGETDPPGDRTAKSIPSLVLLDINMPGMSGIQLLQRLRKLEHMRSVPIVMLTSSNEARDLRDSYDSGATSFIRKRIDGAKFADSIVDVVSYWLVLNEGFKGSEP